LPEQSQTMFPPWLIPIITAVLGFVIAVFIEKFKNRTVLLKYRKNIFQLATSIQNAYWGNIEVLYNNRKTNHISHITVEIKNDSNLDLENVTVDFWVDPDSQMLSHQSNYVENGNFIDLERNYKKEFNDVIELNDEDQKSKVLDPNHLTLGLQERINWVLKNKKFFLPVFNRKTTVKFQLLVENFNGKIPSLSQSILHKSCKLIQEVEEDQIIKTRNKYVGWIWLLLSTLTTIIIYIKFKNNEYAIIWSGALSFLSLYIAFMLFQLAKAIKRFSR